MKRRKYTAAEQLQWLRDHMNHDDPRCLRWPFGYDDGVGRGRMLYEGKSSWAHRVMCTLVNGPAPEDKPQSAHSCGNGHMGCVHPKHLSWATQSENHKDRRKHGTAATNKYGSRTRLTLEQIAQIRALKGRQPQMQTAREFGISHACVRRWQATTHEPAKPGTSYEALRRRQKRMIGCG